MSSDKLHLVTVTDYKPKRQVKVASGALLEAIAVGNLTLTDLEGFTLEDDGTKTPITSSGTWHLAQHDGCRRVRPSYYPPERQENAGK